MKRIRIIKLMPFLLIFFSQIAKAQNLPQISLMQTFSVSAPNPDKWEYAGGYFSNANYNNSYNLSITKDAFVLRCGLKADCVFFPHLFPHAFQQGYTQTFPQTVDNSIKNLAYSAGISWKNDFSLAKVVYKIGNLSLTGGIPALKNPAFSTASAIPSLPNPEYGTTAAFYTSNSKNPIWAGNILIKPESLSFPNISLGGSWNNEAYLSIYKYFSSTKTDASLISWGYSLTGGINRHKSLNQTTWFTSYPYYKEDFFQGYEGSFYTRTIHSANVFKMGITESPFDDPSLWFKDSIMLNLNNYYLSAGFFYTPLGRYTFNGSRNQKKLQFQINPGISFKAGKNKINTGLLWQQDILTTKKTENTFALELELISKRFSLDAKSSIKINHADKTWVASDSVSYSTIIKPGKNSGEISLKINETKNTTIKISETQYFSNMLIDSAGINGSVNIKYKNSELIATRTLESFVVFAKAKNNLKVKGKIEFSAIF